MTVALETVPTVAPGSPRTSDVKVVNALGELRDQPSGIQKFMFLRSLQKTNPIVFYKLLLANTEEILPFVYTPTVGEACQKYHSLPVPAYGLFLRATDKGRFLDLLRAYPEQDIHVVVVTDGERILGLGDLGAGGMGISEGKSLLYTAAAGVPPHQILPVCLDVGTNHKALLEDPMYHGLKQKRPRGEEYHSLVAEFVEALQIWRPHVLLQWEDFGNHNAFDILNEYRDKICCFNDDIQGTACITLSGLLSGLRATGKPLNEQTILFYGAGEAGTGIGELIALALERRFNMSREEARRHCWYMDSKGLVVSDRLGELQPHKVPFAHEGPRCANLLEAVRTLRPTAIIGVSTISQAFNEEVLKAMSEINERPIIMPLSNPTSKAECTHQQAFDASGGRCVFASGSPFPPLHHGGRTYYPAQANNALVFPAVGHAAALCKARAINNDVFLVTAEALSQMTTLEEVEQGLLFPRFSAIKGVSAKLMAVVANFMVSTGLGTLPADFDDVVASAGMAADAPILTRWEAYARRHMFDPSGPAKL